MARIKLAHLISAEDNNNLVWFPPPIFSCFKISKLVLKHAAFISLEGNNIPLAKFLGQAHVYFGMDQKLGEKITDIIWGKICSQLGTNLSGK